MIVSNEPGYYETGSYGIRIENLLIVAETLLPEFSGKKWLKFEKLTYIPLQKKMIDTELLTFDEIQWINNYHEQVRLKIESLMISPRGKKWLIDATASI